jgi:hypothetical protein
MAITNRIGCVFGRLTVISDSGLRSKKGDVFWACLCSCGATKNVVAVNLKSGKTQSCGCLAKEMSAKRAKDLFTKEKKICSVSGCESDTRKGGNGLCGKHAQRQKRYGDTSYVTPENIRAMNSRLAQLEKKEPSKDTYKKFYGRHEHRVIGEQIAGRKLKSNEHVHHIDGNKHNNSRENLMILTAEEHARLHANEAKNAS